MAQRPRKRKAERIKNRLECKIRAIKEDDRSLFRIDNNFVVEVGDIVEFIYLGKVYKGLVINMTDHNHFNIIVDGGNTFDLTSDEIICNKTDKSTKTKSSTQKPKLNDEALYKIKKWEDEINRINETLKQKYNYYLYNILDDHKIKIDADIESLEKLVEFLIYNKFFNSKKKTNTEFINYIQSLRN